MVLLEENMLSIKSRFNKRFLALRDLKRQIALSILSSNKRVEDINQVSVSSKSRSGWKTM